MGLLVAESNHDEEVLDDDFIFYSLLYSSITVVFALAVLSKFLTNEFRFGFRAFTCLMIAFIGEPTCHFLVQGPQGVAIFGLVCLFVYSVLPASHMSGKDKAILVTGCDSGFGHELAKKLDSLGCRVFACCLYKEGQGALTLKNNCSERLRIIQLDVTNENQVNEAVQFVTLTLNGKGLWGLVNNAGIWYAADLEMTPERIFRKTLEVNLFGMMCVTKKFLPLIKKTKGRIVNMSSVTAKLPLEGFGAYCVSNSGVEAYSDVLRLEMKKWGVYVSVVEPSGYSTAAVDPHFIRKSKDEIWNHLDAETRSTYGKSYFDKMYENIEASLPNYPKDLTPVVRVMRAGLLSKRPRSRYQVGLGAGTLVNLYPILPMWLADYIIETIGFTVRDINPIALQN